MGHRRIRYADVAATVALVVACSGGAYAAGLANNSVKSRHIANGQVKTTDLGAGAVTQPKVKGGYLAASRVMHGDALQAFGVHEQVFAWPEAGWTLRGDGDADIGDLGVQVVNTRGGSSVEVYALGAASVAATPVAGTPYTPSAPSFWIIDRTKPARSTLVTCTSRANAGEPAVAFCMGWRGL